MAAEESEEPTDTTKEDAPQDHVDTPNDDIQPEPETEPEPEPSTDFSGQIQELRDEISQVKAMLDAMGIGGGSMPEPESEPEGKTSYDSLFADEDDDNE